MLVCLDTNILIWGVQGVSRPTQAGMIEKTKKLLEFLVSNRFEVIVPSVVLGEYLMHFADDMEREQRRQEVSERFLVAPYDALTSSIFSQIWNTNASKDARRLLRADGIVRNHVKADCMIVATAVGYRCKYIYSNDTPLRDMASGFIEVRDVSVVSGPTPKADPASDLPLFFPKS